MISLVAFLLPDSLFNPRKNGSKLWDKSIELARVIAEGILLNIMIKKGIYMAKDKRISGVCKYCGQSRFIQWDADEPITQAEADEIATKECDCEDASTARNRERKIQRAQEWVRNRFEGCPGIIALFDEAIKETVNHEAETISIKIGEWTHKIFVDSDGYLTIKSGKKVDEEATFA